MRVSMSAMGSLMLILESPSLLAGSPAGLDDAGDVALKGELADLVAREAEHPERAARAAGDAAAVAQPRRVRVARQLLQLQAGGVALLVGLLRVVDDRLQLGVLLRVLGDELLALVLALLQGRFGHCLAFSS